MTRMFACSVGTVGDIATSPTTVSCCSPAGEPLDLELATRLAERLKALADPIRLQLVSLIASSADGELCACDLPALVDRSQATVSHHLGILAQAGVLEREQRGKWAWFRLVPDALAELSASIAPTP